jgi:hypothetical protein
VAVPLFLALAAAHLLLAPAERVAGALAVAAGVAALVCMDRVYVVMARDKRSRLDDVAAVTSALLLAGALAGEAWLFVPASFLRLEAFFERLRRGGEVRDVGALAGVRIALGYVAPASVWLMASSPLLFGAWTLVALAELADRAHFYDSLDVVTPRGRMASDLAGRIVITASSRSPDPGPLGPPPTPMMRSARKPRLYR